MRGIRGLGVDVEDVARVRRMARGWGERLVRRLLAPRERARLRKVAPRRRAEHLAGRFAAKEAVLKALGTGLDCGIRWTEIEVVPDRRGAPRVRLSGRAAEVARARGIARIHAAVSHTALHAAAVAIAEG